MMMALSVLIIKIKKPDLGIQQMIGLGDILLFLSLSFGFPTVNFLVILVGSLIFSLLAHLINREKREDTVPLAGYSSLFLLLLMAVHWFGFYPQLYSL